MPEKIKKICVCVCVRAREKHLLSHKMQITTADILCKHENERNMIRIMIYRFLLVWMFKHIMYIMLLENNDENNEKKI